MRKRYTNEFKENMVTTYLKGTSISALSQQYGISRSTIYLWIAETQHQEDAKGNQVNLRTFSNLNHTQKVSTNHNRLFTFGFLIIRTIPIR